MSEYITILTLSSLSLIADSKVRTYTWSSLIEKLIFTSMSKPFTFALIREKSKSKLKK